MGSLDAFVFSCSRVMRSSLREISLRLDFFPVATEVRFPFFCHSWILMPSVIPENVGHLCFRQKLFPPFRFSVPPWIRRRASPIYVMSNCVFSANQGAEKLFFPLPLTWLSAEEIFFFLEWAVYLSVPSSERIAEEPCRSLRSPEDYFFLFLFLHIELKMFLGKVDFVSSYDSNLPLSSEPSRFFSDLLKRSWSRGPLPQLADKVRFFPDRVEPRPASEERMAFDSPFFFFSARRAFRRAASTCLF